MARRKPPDDEIPITEEPLKKKVVQAKHTVVYESPVTVPADESEADDADLLDFEDKPKQRKIKTSKEERDALRAKLSKAGVTPSSGLRVHIFKFDLENDAIGGPGGDKAFCMKFWTNEDAILNNQQHLDAAQKYGPGRYLFMMYKENKLVTSWEEKISGQTMPGTVQQNGQQVFTDPNNPGVTIQMPANQQPDVSKLLRDHLKGVRETAEMMGWTPAGQQQNPQPILSPEHQLAATLLLDADIKKKAVRSLLGSNGESDKDIPTLLIENAEPIGKMLEGILDKIADRFFGANQNGQAQMDQSPLAQQRHSGFGGQQQASWQDGQIQAIQESSGQALESHFETLPQGQVAITPEDELFSRVLNFCKRKTPIKIAAENIVAFANAVEENPPALAPNGQLVRQYPIGSSVWPYVEMFVEMPAEKALELAGKEVAELEWAKTWCEQLQAELKPAVEQGGEQE
jgi:hypothetical protein